MGRNGLKWTIIYEKALEMKQLAIQNIAWNRLKYSESYYIDKNLL